MIAAAVIIVLALVIVTVVIAGALRRVVRDEADVERRLRAPKAPHHPLRRAQWCRSRRPPRGPTTGRVHEHRDDQRFA